MSGEQYYNHGNFPAANSQGASAAMRNELEAIEAGFHKLPTLGIANAVKLVWVKPDGSGLEAIEAFTDITRYNASTSAHGLMPKLSGSLNQYMRGDGAWASPGIASAMTTSARTTNTQIVSTDSGSLIRYTGSVNFTQTFALPAALTAGFFCYLHNTGTAEIELTAPGSISATSTTSNSIAAGTTWTLPTGLTINPGDQFVARRTSDAFNQRITGTVASYNSGTGVLVGTVQGRIGNGTFTDWTFTIGTATIDGLPSYVMYAGEMRLLACNGTLLQTALLHPYSITRIASGFFVKPPGYRQHGGLLWGGGGSGSWQSGTGSHGGGGACHAFTIPETMLPAVTSFVVAAGGAAVTTLSVDGNPGGMSSFGVVRAYGGGGTILGVSGGGGGILSAGVPGNGGGPKDINPSDGSALASGQFCGASGSNAHPAGDSMYGGAGGGGGDSIYGGGGGGGGTSVFGGNGGTTGALDGVAPGGGGAGTSTGPTSGAGARGELRVWGIA